MLENSPDFNRESLGIREQYIKASILLLTKMLAERQAAKCNDPFETQTIEMSDIGNHRQSEHVRFLPTCSSNIQSSHGSRGGSGGRGWRTGKEGGGLPSHDFTEATNYGQRPVIFPCLKLNHILGKGRLTLEGEQIFLASPRPKMSSAATEVDSLQLSKTAQGSP